MPGWFAVVGDDGIPLSARRASRLLGFQARCTDAEAGEGVEVETPEGMVLDAADPMLARVLRDHLDRHRPYQRAGHEAFCTAGLDVRCQRHAGDECQQRPQMGQRQHELSFRGVDGAEDHVGGLHIGEHPAARDVRVGVEETVRQRQQQCEPHAARALGVLGHPAKLAR